MKQFNKCYELITETGKEVICSYNQAFWTEDQEWIEVENLVINKKIKTIDGYEKIKSIRSVGNKTVYDITTKTHEFIANGIKVHNTGKTLLVKSMAKELNMSIIRILPENIKGK